MKRSNHTITLLSLLFVLTGCQSYKGVPYLQDIPKTETSTHETATSLYDARIMPKDLLTIVVSCPEEPELAAPFNPTPNSSGILQQYLVDNAGNVDFPILGILHLRGLTKSEAEQLIKEKLSPQFHQTPIVTVRMVNYKISVIGEVMSPGTFIITNEKVNVLEALAMAGDMTIYGIRNNVKLIREDNLGKKEIVSLNLNDQDLLLSPYYYMQQNDILYITPNKTKAKTSDISASTTIWFSIVTTLTSLTTLIISIAK